MSVYTNSTSSSPEEVQQYVGAVLGLLGDRNAFDVLREMPAALASIQPTPFVDRRRP